MPHSPNSKKLQVQRCFTALVITAERLTACFWRTIFWVMFFAALWLLRIPFLFTTMGPGLFFILFLTGLVVWGRQGVSSFHWPKKETVDRRLEQDSNLLHRPLAALKDTLSNPQKESTERLWKKRQIMALSALSRLRLPRPRPVMAKKDPAALRILAVLLFVIGLGAAGPRWQERITFGLFPFSIHGPEKKADNIALWITPPEYTGIAPITLQGTGRYKKRIEIPSGSVLKTRVNNGLGQPHLVIDTVDIPMERTGEKGWAAETTIMPSDNKDIIIRQLAFPRARIPFDYIEDTPPKITLRKEPETLPKGPLQLPLTVEDDYGVTDMTLRVTLDPIVEEAPLGQPVKEIRAVMSPAHLPLDLDPVYDLTWHSWAGLPAIITIEVKDHLNQTTQMPPLHMTLPERSFYHPIAKTLIEMRKRLTWERKEAATGVAFALEKLLAEPHQFQHDIVVFLSIRSASSRLSINPTTESIQAVISQLWDTALHIEEGNLVLAARNLRNARQNLEQVLNDPEATAAEITAAVDEMQDAMTDYFREIYKELQKRMAEDGHAPSFPPEMFANTLDPEELTAFMNQLHSEALSGNRDSARQLLSQLQQFMDSLDPAMSMEMPPDMKFMMEGINKLQELIEKQQELLDQTIIQADKIKKERPQSYAEFLPFEGDFSEKWEEGDMPPPPQSTIKEKGKVKPPAIDTQANKVEQDALRYILGQLMLEADEQLNEIPENMQLAEQEMRNSAAQLGENRPDLSLPHQEQAIKYLKEAMEDLSQKVTAMMKQMTSMAFGMGPLDPLGRPLSEGNGPSLLPGSQIKIPDETERKRVKEILNLLRKRSGELNRPDYELDYFRRLMKQF